MRVLLTGAFGNVGRSTLFELLRQGHQITCFDVGTKANRRAARRFLGRIQVVWGDLRQPDDVRLAVSGADAVIHLGFIVPKLSVTGFECEDHPDWAREVNVGGTRNLLEAMAAQPVPPRIVFASSYHVYGRTQHLPPPRTLTDPVAPIEHYAHHKVECEALVRASGLPWTILRLAATLPIALKLDPGMFDIPLDNRMEYVHTQDAGAAFAAAVESPDVCSKTLLVGGGPRCQYTYGEIVQRLLGALGMNMLPRRAFSLVPFATDWLDTEESQRLLRYQSRTLDDYSRDVSAALGARRNLVRLFRPLVRYLLLQQSPHYRAGQVGWLATTLRGLRALKGRPVRLPIR